MAIGRRESERAAVPVGQVPQTVGARRIRGIDNERGVTQLRGQQVSAQDALGVVVGRGIAPPAQDQGRLQDVARVVGLAPVRGMPVLVAAVLHHPAKGVADAPESVVVEGLDTFQQHGIRRQVR